MKLPERAAELGYNALFAHLIDDEGCAIRFDSHPEFSSPYAFTKEQVGDWVAEAERCGHLVVPEIECFGHTGYIHRQPRYEHLALIGSDSLNAIDPTHPETREVFRDLIAEVASLFGGPWMHLGFDEVDPGTGHALHAPRADADWDDLFVEHLAFAQGEAERHGKRALIWADHLLANPKLAERVSRDVLLCDWQYAIDVDGSTTVRLRDAGFDVLACPASNRAMEVVVPGRNTLGNLARTAGFAHAQTPRIGTVNTFWCPQRMLIGAADFALYLGGRWAQTPHLTEAEGLAAYAADWHGLAADAAAEAGAAIGRLSELTLNRTEWRDLLGTHPLSRPRRRPRTRPPPPRPTTASRGSPPPEKPSTGTGPASPGTPPPSRPTRSPATSSGGRSASAAPGPPSTPRPVPGWPTRVELCSNAASGTGQRTVTPTTPRRPATPSPEGRA